MHCTPAHTHSFHAMCHSQIEFFVLLSLSALPVTLKSFSLHFTPPFHILIAISPPPTGALLTNLLTNESISFHIHLGFNGCRTRSNSLPIVLWPFLLPPSDSVAFMNLCMCLCTRVTQLPLSHRSGLAMAHVWPIHARIPVYLPSPGSRHYYYLAANYYLSGLRGSNL